MKRSNYNYEVTFDYETRLEDMECTCCGQVGLIGYGGDTCLCPNCGEEIVFDYKYPAEILKYTTCINCGSVGNFIFDKEDGDKYICTECGQEGSIQEDYDSENYLWDEVEDLNDDF